MRVSIAYATLLVGLTGFVMVAATVVAEAEEDFNMKVDEVENKIGMLDLMFALNLGHKLEEMCDKSGSKDHLSLSVKLEGELKVKKCAQKKLKNGVFLLQILRFAAEKQQGELEYLDLIRKQENSVSIDLEVNRLIYQGRKACQNYVEEFTPFYEEAKNSKYGKSDSDFGNMVLAREACQLFLTSYFTEKEIESVQQAAAYTYMQVRRKQAAMGQKFETNNLKGKIN